MSDDTSISWYDAPEHPEQWAVHVRIPPELDRCPIVRSVVGCAMAVDGWDSDDVIDVRLALDEVCNQVVAAALPGTVVDVALGSGGERVVGLVAGDLHPAASLDLDGFGWPLVAALTDLQVVKYRGHRNRSVEVRFVKQRARRPSQ